MTLSMFLKVFAVVVLVAVGLMFAGVVFTVALPNTAFAWTAGAAAAWLLSTFIGKVRT